MTSPGVFAIQQLVKIAHCKDCKNLNFDTMRPITQQVPEEAICKLLNGQCIRVLPHCKKWKLKEVIPPRQQPTFVNKTRV